jgi:DNA-binding MarR family transcriptional regulator
VHANSSLAIEDQIVAALRRIIRAVDLQSKHLSDACGLTGPQLVTLHTTARLGGASVVAIARAVHLSSATVTGILNRLEKRGLIERTRSASDRRSVIATVTAEGESLLEAAPSLLQDRFRQKLAGLETWEATMMLAMLQRIAAMMDAEEIPAAPVLVTGAAGESFEGPASEGAEGESRVEADDWADDSGGSTPGS